MATLADLQLNVKILIMNNGSLGLVRQQQEMIYQKHYIGSKFITNPDFAAIARGFGISSCDLSKEDKPLAALAKVMACPGPWVVNIPIKEDENVLPIVPPGKGNTEMIGGEHNE
jgi:acetolactate synthase-1/2/3 large subunit